MVPRAGGTGASLNSDHGDRDDYDQNDIRKYGYSLPPLAETRQNFETAVGRPLDWEEVASAPKR